MTTKQKVLESALTLFSEKGYDGTGVDELAERAGIKGPSVYRHYTSKESILNYVVDFAEKRYEVCFESDVNIDGVPKNKKEFIRNTMDRFKFILTDPMMRKIRIFFVREQFRTERLAKVARRVQLDGLFDMYEEIISRMMKEGLIIEGDPAYMAIELVSPVTFFIAQVDSQPKYEDSALETIELYIRNFSDKYMT